MLLLSIPLVYAGNVLRIVAIIVAAQWGGQAWGDRIHAVMGFGVFIVVVGGVVATAETISRLKPQWAIDAPREGPGSAASPPARSGVGPVGFAVVLLAAFEALFLARRAAQPPDESRGVVLSGAGANPAELPTFLGANWMGHRVEPEAVERAILPPDTGFSRKFYVNLDEPGQHVLLSIVLSGRDRTSIHRPELCVVAQGWTLVRSSPHHFTYPGRPDAGFDATVLSVRHDMDGPRGHGTLPNIIAYWFVGDERVVASQATRMLYDAWSRLAHGRAPRWAYVYLQTSSADGEEAGLARIQSILDSALPSFQPAYPESRVIGGAR